MQKLGLPGMKGLDHLRSLNGTLAGPGRAIPTTSPRLASDSVSYGSFANLKLTAEKLLKEQASAKTDLEMAHAKLKKAEEHIHALEAKLQEVVNENAKIRVKQTEDAKLWKGLDSKLSSTKMLCDQLTETLQHLACQACTAEEDKKFFEEKLSANSKQFVDIDCQIHDLSAKLECAGKTIESGKRDMLKLVHEKEEMEKRLKDECHAAHNLIKEKDNAIKQFEDAIQEGKAHLKTLDSELQRMQYELGLKEDICKCLSATQEKLEDENNALSGSNEELLCRIDKSVQQIKMLEDSFCSLVTKVVELDKQSVTVSDNVIQLFSLSESCYKMAQKEKKLAIESAQGKLDQLHKEILQTRSDNGTLRSDNEELRNKILELQKTQEFVMVQNAEECRLAEDKIRKLEAEVEVLLSKKGEIEKSATALEEKVKHLSEASSQTEIQMKDLLEKISKLESENQDIHSKAQLTLQERAVETETLRNELAIRDCHISSLEEKISQLHDVLGEKDQINLQYREREKQLEEQKLKIQESLAAAECKLTEVKNQYDLILEGKQLELSKHLKEISQRNDQAINDIRRKYEMEKLDVANAEIEKANKLIKEMERKCEERILESKEEARQYLMHVKEEHGSMISRIQQENDQKESNLRAYHKEELLRVQIQAENEIREKASALRKEHEIQIKALKLQHEDDCRKLEEELELQKSKEEKQRALLQLQWKVMSENQHDDQATNSKKAHSDSSIKMGGTYSGKENRLSLPRPETGKDVDFSGLTHTPVANLMKKAQKGNTENAVSIPKHRKVTHHEYEVETLNGKTITKHRKTKSTVMFGEPHSHKRGRTKTPNANKDVIKLRKVIGGATPHTSIIGDLCSEGSLNPYADDPYAFD